MNNTSRAIIVFVVISILPCVSTIAFAARYRTSKPSSRGAGKLPTAQASSTSSKAWIYTGDFRNTAPAQISGSIQITASKGTTIGQDRADVTAKFIYQKAIYSVNLTSPYPISGEDFPGHGPVQFMRPVLGPYDLGTLNLPETHAHLAIYSRATIRHNGKLIADNQPAIVFVNEAIHGSDQQYLSSPATDRNEISLIVPGPLNGQKFVKSFTNGAFYIYWPNVKLTISGNVVPKPMSVNIPNHSGKGPTMSNINTQQPSGTIDISLTNTGIVKQIGKTPSGLYDLNITNNSPRPRGLMIIGTDLCCTTYTRYSQVLSPGGSQIFRWYFAPGKVQIRDFLGGTKTTTAYTNVKLGGHSSSIVFD